jgi:PhnB protein
MQITPYLFFDGRTDEAIAFYKKVLGAQVEMLMRFKESPDPGMSTPDMAEKVMHASVRIGNATVFVSDGMCGGRAKFEGFSLAISATSPAEAERLFAALGEGGQIQMPMTETFFSPRFGMVADRFGVSWQVIVGK